MKVIRFIFLLITAPLTATLVVYFIDLMEPALRSILGIAQATEDYWVPDAIGFVFILFVFFFFHILFLCLAWLLSRLGYKRSNKNIIICLHSLIASVSAAFIFHAPETGDLFLSIIFDHLPYGRYSYFRF